MAFFALAGACLIFSRKNLGEKWPDETTRKLLAERAAQDNSEFVCQRALATVARKWSDEATRRFLAGRARIDGVAASVFGGLHSEFGRIVFSYRSYPCPPYLDPAKPVPRDHIEQAAKNAGVPVDKIDETVRSLSAHMGWDIRKGAAR